MSPTVPIWGLFVIRMLVLATINVCAKFKVSNFIHYGNTKGNAKYTKYEKIAHENACNREMTFKDTQGHRY